MAIILLIWGRVAVYFANFCYPFSVHLCLKTRYFHWVRGLPECLTPELVTQHLFGFVPSTRAKDPRKDQKANSVCSVMCFLKLTHSLTNVLCKCLPPEVSHRKKIQKTAEESECFLDPQ